MNLRRGVQSSSGQTDHQAFDHIAATEAVGYLDLVFLGRADILDADHACEIFARR